MTREEAIEKIKNVINQYVGYIRKIENINIIVDKQQLYVNFIVYVDETKMFNVMMFNDNSFIIELALDYTITRKKELSVLYSMWEEIENILDKVDK